MCCIKENSEFRKKERGDCWLYIGYGDLFWGKRREAWDEQFCPQNGWTCLAGRTLDGSPGSAAQHRAKASYGQASPDSVGPYPGKEWDRALLPDKPSER